MKRVLAGMAMGAIGAFGLILMLALGEQEARMREHYPQDYRQ